MRYLVHGAICHMGYMYYMWGHDNVLFVWFEAQYASRSVAKRPTWLFLGLINHPGESCALPRQISVPLRYPIYCLGTLCPF
jgi:hypothetical protein